MKQEEIRIQIQALEHALEMATSLREKLSIMSEIGRLKSELPDWMKVDTRYEI